MTLIDETGKPGGPIIQQTDQQLQRLGELRVRTREYAQDLRALSGAGKDAGETLAPAFTGAAMKGKDLSDSFKSIILSLSQRTLRSATNSFSGALSAGLKGLFSSAMANANGNAFSQGRVIAMARGGIVSGPTLFPMGGGGAGLMGEAGPEAVLPLARGADGRLGVRAGDGGGRAVTINFNVTTPDVEGFRRSEAQISAMLQRAAARGARNL